MLVVIILKKGAYIGTANGAFFVQTLRKNAITTYPEIKVVRHIEQTGANEFLIHCQSCGRYLLREGEFSQLLDGSCLGEGRQFSGKKELVSDRNGGVWLKDFQHIHRYTPDSDGNCITHTFDFNTWSATFITDQLVALIVNETNQLIIYDLENQKEINISEAPIFFSGRTHHMYVDDNQILWVASNKGLYKVDISTGETKQYGDTDDFEDDRILVIHDDQKGRLWLGTANQGVHVFDIQKEEVVLVIDEADGLSNNIVVGILEDDDGVIWAATYNGLNLIRPNGEIITILNEKDGLLHYEFNRHAHFKARDGRLFFGTLHGLNVIDPKQIKQSLKASAATKIYISELSFFDDDLDKVVQVRNYFPSEKKLVLPADKRFLSIRVGMSKYGMNSKKRYAYQLEGVDDDWTYMGTEHFIRLPNLPAGNYTLKIAGIDQNGNWSANTIRIPIYGKEFFYKQSWFYILLTLPFLVFALIWIRRLRKEKDMLEKEVDKRTIQIRKDKELIEQQATELKQLDQMKSRFFANISHDFRTPLTLITGPAELIDQDDTIPKFPKLKQSLQSILQNGKKLLNLVDEMLDLAKIESHQIKLYEEKVNLQVLVESIYTSYQAATQGGEKVQFQWNYQIPPGFQLLTDPRRLEKILNNLLSNAFKFTEEGIITFRIYIKQDELYFEVTDSGKRNPSRGSSAYL